MQPFERLFNLGYFSARWGFSFWARRGLWAMEVKGGRIKEILQTRSEGIRV